MSERVLDADLKAAAESGQFNYVAFVKLDFIGGTISVHNSVGKLSFGGVDYVGVGTFGSIRPITQSVELVDQPIYLQLSSIDEEMIEEIQTEELYGVDVEVFIGTLDSEYQLLGTPTSWVVGTIEHAVVKVGKENSITLSIQTRAAKLVKKNNKRWTMEEHQKEFPGERTFEYLPYIINADLVWGGEKVRIGFTGGSITNVGGSFTGGGGNADTGIPPKRRQ